MDVSTGLIAVIVDDGKVGVDALVASVNYARSAPEIIRAVVMTARPDAIAAAVSPAAALPATAAELSGEPNLPAMQRAAAWCEKKDGEATRLVLWLRPDLPIADPLVVYEVLQRIITNGFADGIVGVRREGDGPRWRAEDGWLEAGGGTDPLVEDPSVLVLRRAFIEDEPRDWRAGGRFLPYEIVPIHR
jgi:hypothetical protein